MLDISLEMLSVAERLLPSQQPIFMLNLLRYKEQASYGAPGKLPPCGGREAYFTRYVPAFAKVTDGLGITPFWVGSVGSSLVAPTNEQWDDVALIRYPDFGAFKLIVSSTDYQRDAEPHRQAALADWRLIATTEMPLPH